MIFQPTAFFDYEQMLKNEPFFPPKFLFTDVQHSFKERQTKEREREREMQLFISFHFSFFFLAAKERKKERGKLDSGSFENLRRLGEEKEEEESMEESRPNME